MRLLPFLIFAIVVVLLLLPTLRATRSAEVWLHSSNVSANTPGNLPPPA